MEILLKTIESEFDEADGWFRIVGADWYADNLRVDVCVAFNDSKEKQVWEISCEQVFSEHIVSEYAGFLSVVKNHPLILGYKEPEIEVAFSKNRLSFHELFGIVASTTFKHLGEQPISTWLNTNLPFYSICGSEYGVLGKFPLTVANEIVAALSEKPISINFLSQHAPLYWNGKEYIEYPESLEVLIIGNSYIIGSGFSAVRA